MSLHPYQQQFLNDLKKAEQEGHYVTIVAPRCRGKVEQSTSVINEALCRTLIKEFYRRTSKQPARVVLSDLIHAVYAQGFAAGQRKVNK